MFRLPWKKKPKVAEREKVPITVELVLRATGPHAKRGIHTTTEQIHGVLFVEPSQLSPFINFHFSDGTQRSIHHDRLLDWHSIAPQ